MRQPVPRPFGYPAWVGVKRRRAKKVLNARGRELLARFHAASQWRVGDLVRTCDGLNSRVRAVTPDYREYRRGRVLVDLDIVTDRNRCSFYHCGVGAPLTYAAAVAYRDALVQRSRALGDPWGFAQRYAAMTIHPDGTYTSGGPACP